MKLIKHYDFTNMTELHHDWNVEVGEKWYNNELQQYVNDQNNLYFDEGLIIKATLNKDIIKSARINTRDNFKFTYGKIEVIAKVPSGKGTWPAIWMMPNKPVYGPWPNSGEIDIMEHNGNDLNRLYCCLHTESYNHRNKHEQYDTRIVIPDLTEDFHTFGLLWEEDKIVYLLDDKELVTYKRGENAKDTSHKGWPFTIDYYLILNLAMGGMFGGKVDMDSFPQKFIVKDIKIYQK